MKTSSAPTPTLSEFPGLSRFSKTDLIAMAAGVSLTTRVEEELLSTEFGEEFSSESLWIGKDGRTFTLKAERSMVIGRGAESFDVKTGERVSFDSDLNPRFVVR